MPDKIARLRALLATMQSISEEDAVAEGVHAELDWTAA
jgi:hypothetical protein